VNFVRDRLSAWTWTALVAVLALALLPTVSRAWGLGAEPVGDHAMVEVCTTDGLRMVPIGEGQAPPDTPAHHADAFERCAHCVLGAAPLALAVVPEHWLIANPPPQPTDLSQWGARRPLQTWPEVQPRAPPVGCRSTA
jgi:hypothetical protein